MDFQRWQAFDTRWTERLNLLEDGGVRRRIAILLAHSGDSWFWLAGLGGAWFVGPEAWKMAVGKTIAAILFLALVVLMVKFRIKRERPAGDWGAIYRSSDPHSFPSGHAARAFTLAVLAFGWGPPWGAVAVAIWAPLVSLARIAMSLHYPSDVLAGALLGLLYGSAAILLFP